MQYNIITIPIYFATINGIFSEYIVTNIVINISEGNRVPGNYGVDDSGWSRKY